MTMSTAPQEMLEDTLKFDVEESRELAALLVERSRLAKSPDAKFLTLEESIKDLRECDFSEQA